MARTINIGDTVRVVNNGKQYPAFRTWAEFHAMRNYAYNVSISNGTQGEVVAKGEHIDVQHIDMPGIVLLGIECNGSTYIIGEDGCELVKCAQFAVGDVVRLVDGSGGSSRHVGTSETVKSVVQCSQAGAGYEQLVSTDSIDGLYNKHFELVTRAVSEQPVVVPPYTVTTDGVAVTFEVGDEVEIVNADVASRAADGMGNSGMWENSMNNSMRSKVGASGTVVAISLSGVRIGGLSYSWPLTALRNLTKQPKPEPKTLGELLKAKIDALLAQRAKLLELEGAYEDAMSEKVAADADKVAADAAANEAYGALTNYRDSI